MRAELLRLVKGQGTADPLISRFLIARQINSAAGGTVIAPWEVDDLPEEWIDAATALAVDLAEMREGEAKVEARLEEWRRKRG